MNIAEWVFKKTKDPAVNFMLPHHRLQTYGVGWMDSWQGVTRAGHIQKELSDFDLVNRHTNGYRLDGGSDLAVGYLNYRCPH